MKDLIKRKSKVVTFSLNVWGTTVMCSPIILIITQLLKTWWLNTSNYNSLSIEIGEAFIEIALFIVVGLVISTPVYLLYILLNFIGIYFYENIRFFCLWSSFCGFILVYSFQYLLTNGNTDNLLIFWIYSFIGIVSVFYYAEYLYSDSIEDSLF